jgi:hypothetical protein
VRTNSSAAFTAWSSRANAPPQHVLITPIWATCPTAERPRGQRPERRPGA